MRPSLLLFFSAAFFIVLVDQGVKQLVDSTFVLGESRTVLPGFANLTYIRNRGAAFGLLAAVPGWWVRWFFIAATFAALGFVFYLFRCAPPETRYGRAALVMVFGGGVGNLVDRIRIGEVIDYIDLYYGAYHWPAFNVADACISIGLVLLLLDFFRQPGKRDASGAGAG